MFKLLSGLFSVVSQPLIAYQARKRLKVEHQFELSKLDQQAKVANAMALIEMAKNGQQIDYSLDKIAMQNMQKSWKDELVLVVFLIPMLMGFHPATATAALNGFAIIAKMPAWYVGIVIGMVVVIYGMRGLLTAYLNRGKSRDKPLNK